MTTSQKLARRIAEVATLHGTFTLRSGATSPIYFDKYRFESDPRLLREITEAMAPLIPRETEALAGLEMGGIPLATMLSQHTGLPAVFVRKQPKTYGTCKLAEGCEMADKRIVMVEDVVTSGGQIVLSARALREAGAELSVVLCVIDREAGGPGHLADDGLELRALFRLSELLSPSLESAPAEAEGQKAATGRTAEGR